MAEDARKSPPNRLKARWLTKKYDLRPTPHVPLRGVRSHIDALYDGEMIAATENESLLR